MKKLFTFLFMGVFCISGTCLAQTNTFPSSGNVGIGINNPSSKLHVSHNVGFLKVGESAAGNNIVWIGASNSNSAELWFRNPGPSYWTVGIDNSDNDKFKIDRGFDTGNNTKLTIDPSGKVGIGTTSPSSKLTVNGTTKTKEVIVKEDVGADFVFERDYPLPDLVKLESFIRSNKHLPGIPSAEEMKRDGVRVGELQMRLLQKIEELTLYVIELRKENQNLTERVSLLEGRQ